MVQKDLINPFEIKQFLIDAFQEQSPVIASFMDKGKWRILELNISGIFDDSVAFNSHANCDPLKAEQPIGICVHTGYYKYLFKTTIQCVGQQGCLWRILMEMPDKAERIQRRMYHRHPVPKTMNVKVMLWHRGYLNDDSDENLDQGYWQGQLLNLSAGGAQFEIASDDQTQFKMGQLLGIQFTPLSYQKPLLLESHIRYLKEQPDTNSFKVGVEFLGLAATPDGKETLARILEVIDQYEKSNGQNLPADPKEIHV